MEFLNNPLVVSLIAGFITIILLKVNSNYSNEKMSNVNLMKIVLLVIVMTLFSFLLHGFSKSTKIKVDHDIFTGNPNF